MDNYTYLKETINRLAKLLDAETGRLAACENLNDNGGQTRFWQASICPTIGEEIRLCIEQILWDAKVGCRFVSYWGSLPLLMGELQRRNPNV